MQINSISSNESSNKAAFGHHFYRQTTIADNDLLKEFKEALARLKGAKKAELQQAMDYFEKHTFDVDKLVDVYSKKVKGFKNSTLTQEWNELIEPYANANEISGNIGIRSGYNGISDGFNTTLHVKDKILDAHISRPDVTKSENLYKLAFDIDNAVYSDITKKYKTIRQEAIEAEKEAHKVRLRELM